jgi:hypothetical protein
MRSEEEIRKHRDDLCELLVEVPPGLPLNRKAVLGVARAGAVAGALSWVLGEDDDGALERWLKDISLVADRFRAED